MRGGGGAGRRGGGEVYADLEKEHDMAVLAKGYMPAQDIAALAAL